jgi:hypothetical protein
MTKARREMANAVANHFITRQMTMHIIDLFEVVYASMPPPSKSYLGESAPSPWKTAQGWPDD